MPIPNMFEYVTASSRVGRKLRELENFKNFATNVKHKTIAEVLRMWLDGALSFSRIENTCTMYELGGIDRGIRTRGIPFELIFYLVKEVATGKIVMFNTNLDATLFDGYPDVKKVYEYRGNDGIVSTYMINVR